MGYAASVVLPYEGPLVDRLEAAGAKTWIMDPVVLRKGMLEGISGMARFARGISPAVNRLAKLIRADDIDLVHSNTGVVLGGAMAARKCGVPHVWHFREVFSEFSRAWSLYEPFVAGKSDRIICISEAVRSQFRKASAQAKTVIVYDGVTMPLVDPASISIENRRGDADFQIVCTGRINQRVKGQHVLVGAVHRLADRGIPVKLVLVGDVFPGKEFLRTELIAQIHELGLDDEVTLAGFVEDVAHVIDGSDLVVVPSTHAEGFGIVVLEAFARGKAVVGSRIGGIPEIIRDEENGLLVEAGDEDSLADAIERLYREPAERLRMAQSGRRSVEERFSVQMAVEQISDIYQQVINGRKAKTEQ